jgi:small-conductance mechanosensitive channel
MGWKDFFTITGLVAGGIILWNGAETFKGLPFSQYLIPLAMTLLAIAAVYFCVKIVLDGIISRQIPDKKTRYTFNKASSVIALAILIVILIRVWIPDTSSVMVSLGLVTAGFAVAFQDVAKNFLGGVVIIVGRLYEVGDRIEIGGEAGDVIDIGLMNTSLLEIGNWMHDDQPTGRMTLIPNGKVMVTQIHNYTKDHCFIWDELSIPLTFTSDLQKAQRVILNIVRKETEDITHKAEKEINQLEEKYYLSSRGMDPSVGVTPSDRRAATAGN